MPVLRPFTETLMDPHGIDALPRTRQRLTTLIVGSAIAVIAFGFGAIAFFMKGQTGWAVFYGLLGLLNVVLGSRAWGARRKLASHP
jgi:hypothetical protein